MSVFVTPSAICWDGNGAFARVIRVLAAIQASSKGRPPRGNSMMYLVFVTRDIY